MEKFICFAAAIAALTSASVRAQEGKTQTEKAMDAAKKNIGDFETHYGIAPKPNESEEARINALIEHIRKKQHETTCAEFGKELEENKANCSLLKKAEEYKDCPEGSKINVDDIATYCFGHARDLTARRFAENFLSGEGINLGSEAHKICEPNSYTGYTERIQKFTCTHTVYSCDVYVDLSNPTEHLAGRNQNSECKDTRTRSEKKRDTKNDRLDKVYVYMREAHKEKMEKDGFTCDEQKFLPTIVPVVCINEEWKCTIKTDKETREVIPNDSECTAKQQGTSKTDPG